jgi:hypothetical protein
MPPPALSAEARSTQVIVRFCLRIIVLTVFASLSGAGFGTSLIVLLWMSTILATVAGALRREFVFDQCLTHWDEAAIYAALYCLVSAINAGTTS